MKFFNKVFDTCGIIAFIGMVLVVLMQIICRFLLKANVPWTEEMSRVVFIYLCYLGTAIAYREKDFIVIDFLINKINAPVRKYLDIFISLFTFSFFIILLMGSIMMLVMVWPTRLSTVENLSTGVLYIPPIICCFGIVVWTVNNCIQSIVNVLSNGRRK